jgi:hypothetical protein
MSVQYHVYMNDGLGGDVDYTSVATTVSALTWDSAPLAPAGDYRW